jgi:NADPH:quinone reductase-like Zn-dependent oxidoreductase
MNAVVFHAHGGTDQLRYEAVPDLTAGSEDVVIRVKACALNHLDVWVRQGIPAYKLALPHISGSDVAGIVEAVGDQVTGIMPGARVFISPGLSCWRCDDCLAGRDNFCSSYGLVGAKTAGGYAEYMKVPARNVLDIPGSLSFREAAAFPLVSVTAMQMLFALGGLQAGEDALIMGAGSGVGSVAVQLAKLTGARVMTTVGAHDKIAKAKELGADLVINHTEEDVAARIKDFTGGRGVDLVIEHIGPAVWTQCVQSLAKGGRLVTCGATTGGDVTLDLRYVYSRQLTIRGSYMGTRAELVRAAQLMGQSKLRAVIDRVFPLQEARAAQEYLLSRRFFGKILLEVV